MSVKQIEKVSVIPSSDEPRALVATPMDMLDRALASGSSPEVIERFMAMAERWEASQARKAFDEAVAKAKAEIPVIVKNATSHNNRYADFATIARTVDPVLSRHGIRYRFRTQQTEKTISVTCVLTHKGGHAEENTLTGPVDATVGKNAIQAIGSTLTYLQRYSLVQSLGLAASNDDDGNSHHTGVSGFSGGEKISPDQLAKLQKLVKEVNANPEIACRHLGIASLADLPADRFDRAMTSLEKKRQPQ